MLNQANKLFKASKYCIQQEIMMEEKVDKSTLQHTVDEDQEIVDLNI